VLVVDLLRDSGKVKLGKVGDDGALVPCLDAVDLAEDRGDRLLVCFLFFVFLFFFARLIGKCSVSAQYQCRSCQRGCRLRRTCLFAQGEQGRQQRP